MDSLRREIRDDRQRAVAHEHSMLGDYCKSMASPAQSHVPPHGTFDMSDINLPLQEDCAERVQSYTQLQSLTSDTTESRQTR